MRFPSVYRVELLAVAARAPMKGKNAKNEKWWNNPIIERRWVCLLSSQVEREKGSEITVLGGMTTPSPTVHNGPTPNLGAKLIDYVRWRKNENCLFTPSLFCYICGRLRKIAREWRDFVQVRYAMLLSALLSLLSHQPVSTHSLCDMNNIYSNDVWRKVWYWLTTW